MLRLVATILNWLALLLVLAGILVAIFGWLDVPPGAFIGGGLLVLGIGVMAGGDVVFAPISQPITAEAEVSRAVLDVSAGLSNLAVRADADYDRLATTLTGALSGPDLDIVDGVAHLRLAHAPEWLPFPADWSAGLTTNVLWDVTATGLLGRLDLDLSSVRADRVEVSTRLGSVHLTCPTRGQVVVETEAVLGDLEVIVPRDVGAHVTLDVGRLATAEVDTAHFAQLDATTYATPDFEAAQARVDITLRVWVGEARLLRA